MANPLSKLLTKISDPQLKKLVENVEQEFSDRPPTIGVVGLSGVGKSTTINAMFGTTLKVSATTRGTSQFEKIDAKLQIKNKQAKGKAGLLRVYDAPGLGEDRRLDEGYLKAYEAYLPKCDVCVWIIAARNRALALDQQYIERLSGVLGNMVFGISQVDLVDPIDWNSAKNLPSDQQKKNIDVIVRDRGERLSDALGRKVEPVAYSSKNYYRLMDLYSAIIDAAPEDRRWLFEMLRDFDATDWLDQATGITHEERARLEAKLKE